jgi:hypothetical protein
VYGDRSHFLGSYEFLRKELPNVSADLLAGGEHFGPLEQPAELTRHIFRFLDAADDSQVQVGGAIGSTRQPSEGYPEQAGDGK